MNITGQKRAGGRSVFSSLVVVLCVLAFSNTLIQFKALLL